MVEPLQTLAHPEATLAQLVSALNTLDRERQQDGLRRFRLGIAANVTLDLLSVYLRRHAYLYRTQLSIAPGDYHNLLGDVERHTQEHVDGLLIVPFFDNILPALEARLAHDDSTARAGIADYLAQLTLALQAARHVGQIWLLSGHRWLPEAPTAPARAQSSALAEFNRELHKLANGHPNVQLIDSEALVSALGHNRAFDRRFYYRSKAPYSPAFLDRLAQQLSLQSRGFGSVFPKLLALDCDGTLWGGVVGERGIQGIDLDPHQYPGNVFWAVQHELLALEQRGVLLALCSKNNAADVEQVLQQHPHCVLKAENFVAQRVNWQDKPRNLQTLAEELNLGLESFVFLDDSAFEVHAVRELLPQVTTFAVPKQLSSYPELLAVIAQHFPVSADSPTDSSKTAQYRQLQHANAERERYSTHSEYLRSLNLELHVRRDAVQDLTRLAELTQKTNQFNLTSERLAPGQLQQFMEQDHTTVYSLAVRDRLSEHGITGLLITERAGVTLEVRLFLLSCRILGRGIEFAVWRAVLADARRHGCSLLRAEYIPSTKNMQVADFFDRLGLQPIATASAGSRQYQAEIANARLADSPWVELYDD